MKYTKEQMFDRLIMLDFGCWVKRVEQYGLGFEVVTIFNKNNANVEVLGDGSFITEVAIAMSEWDI